MRFSDRVLELTKKIPKGKVTTYKAIAEKLNTRAYRAVGNALNKNKHPVIIPCHRVVNHDGRIGGYGGGLPKKISILKKEGIEVKNGEVVDFEKKRF